MKPYEYQLSEESFNRMMSIYHSTGTDSELDKDEAQKIKILCLLTNVPYSQELYTRINARLAVVNSLSIVKAVDLIKEIHNRMENAWKPE